MNTTKKNIKIILCDNVDGNNILEENGAKNSEEIKYEFTSPCTPQKNGVVERRFDTLYSWMRAMMAPIGLHESLKTEIWSEGSATTTKLENIVVNPHEEK